MALSDYKGEEAVDIMLELVEPVFAMLQKPGVTEKLQKETNPLGMAKILLKNSKKEAIEILEIIDPTPVDGENITPRFISMFLYMMRNPYWRDFFGLAEIPNTKESSSLPTANTEASEN